MILILSHESIDEPTNVVIDWLDFYEADFIRLNGDDFRVNKTLKLDINNSEIVSNNDLIISENTINVIWYRRWKQPQENDFYFDKYSKLNLSTEQVKIIEKYNKFLKQEELKLNGGIFSVFKNKYWIPQTRNARGNLNKLDVLLRAKYFGLNIPNTIITAKREEVLSFFYNNNNSIITKPISEADTMIYDDIQMPMFTKVLNEKEIKGFPPFFFPSLFQNNIKKKFEIRTFIHRKKIFSMAMFTQNDIQTTADFRNYNINKPNRYVPFVLPKDLGKKILKLLQDLELNTGSIDLIYGDDDKYYFLEINPLGQFGMVSINCNYNIEKTIAEDLIQLNLKKSKK